MTGALGLTLALAACGGTAAPAASPAGSGPTVSGAAKPASSAAATGSPGATSAKPSGTGSAAASAAAKPASFDDLVAAAKKEGHVTVYGTPGTPYRQALVDDFQKAFPGIQVEAIFVSSAERQSRLTLERQSNQYLADIWISPGGNQVADFKSQKWIVPLEQQIVLPEINDTSKWFENHLWWVDKDAPHAWAMPVGSVIPIAFVNKNMVDPAQFKSFNDLLDPKWKGKMAATDIRNSGPGVAPSRMLFTNKDLGPAYIGKLFGQTDLHLSADQRQLIDWVSQGVYPIGLFIDPGEVQVAVKQGLPIAPVTPEQFKEGAPVGPNNAGIAIIDRAPHPAAAQLYLNWYLSKDGQLTWQKEVGDNSFRTDISKDDVNPLYVTKAGSTYVNVGGEDIVAQVPTTLIKKTIDEARNGS